MQLALIIFLTINTVLLVIIILREFAQNNKQSGVERLVREEMSANRSELGKNLESFTKQLLTLTQINDQKLEKVRDVVETQLKNLREDNSQRLEKMRETVDEKLQSTLEKRLGDSFKLVSDRLEKVHQGLGEMQALATGVGDLKKVLTNVKTRGIWGEIQLVRKISTLSA